jgi:MtN3 and saliva related transmembrane protein
MSILASLATVSGIVASFAMIPQAYKIFKRKSAKDISMITYSFLFLAGIIWVLYGIEITSFPVIITNSIGSLIIVFIMIGWFLYGRTIKTSEDLLP